MTDLKKLMEKGYPVIFSNEETTRNGDIRTAHCRYMRLPGGMKYILEFNGQVIGTWKTWRNFRYRLEKLIRQWDLVEKKEDYEQDTDG